LQKRQPKKQKSSSETLTIRDPLYGFIEINEIEKVLLSCKFLQRLTRIKQLGHTYVVYPSAVHNRFEHSLGTLYVAGRICEQLKLSKKDTRLIRIGALLHDIGHGPFSHVFEKLISEIAPKTSHESITKLIIENDTELKKGLDGLTDEILQVVKYEKGTVRSEILSGVLDADKLDYLRRDSYHTGVAYGIFDFERIIRNLCIIEDEERQYIGIHEKGRDAVESYRMARYLMHKQVYEHHARLIAEDMFLKAVRFAFEESVLDRDALNPNVDVNYFLKYFFQLDDNSIQHTILTRSKGKAQKILLDLLNRNLLKRAYIIPISAEAIPDWRERTRFMRMKQEEINELENEIASKAGLGFENLIVHLQSTEIKLYERPEETVNIEDETILVKHYDGSVRHISEESPFSASRIPKRLYVFCPKNMIEKVGKIAEDVIGVKNYYAPKL
jgi:hypothetical protein